MSSNGVVPSVMAPNKRGSPSITPIGIGLVFVILGKECVWAKRSSIKQIVAPESSRALVRITRVPTYKLTATSKPFWGVLWIELFFWLMEPNCIAPIATWPFCLLLHGYPFPDKKMQDVQMWHNKYTGSCLIDVVVDHWTMIKAQLYPQRRWIRGWGSVRDICRVWWLWEVRRSGRRWPRLYWPGHTLFLAKFKEVVITMNNLWYCFI